MRTIIGFFLLTLLWNSCSKSELQKIENKNTDANWLIPVNEILNTFESKDHIQSIDSPIFTKASNILFMKDNETVFAIKELDIVKVYPVKIMQQHEIVNDSIGKLYFAVSYCPQTKSGICFNRQINGKLSEFGVSGMLYKENLMPYDRNTESIWSQMLGKCVYGQYSGTKFETIMMITTNWQTIKKAYPKALVLTETISKSEGNGSDNNSDNTDKFSAGAFFYGIVNSSQVELYSYESLKEQIADIKQGKLIIGSEALNYINGFKQDRLVLYRIVQDSLPLVLADNEGNKWDMFGYALEGKRKGDRLHIVNAYSASLWAWEAFYEINKVLEF